jgi:peptide-N4-(N-acetyl-beta-glucosaminyl)asparagine amidase
LLTITRKALKAVTVRRRLGLPVDVIKRLEEEDGTMLKWLEAPDNEQGDDEHLEARQSGNEEWKEARGEAGTS